MLCLPIGTIFESNARCLGPLGPRDEDWIKKVAENEDHGQDFFAWWNSGLNAEYFLGRALARMWTEIRWRKPISDLEHRVLKYVIGSLDIAYKLNPELEFPWAEWQEMLVFSGMENSEMDFVRDRASNTKASAGYRRREVRVSLPAHWSLRIPGSFSSFIADEEGDLCAEDPPRTIWFTAYNFATEPEECFADACQRLLEKPPTMLVQYDRYLARAEIKKNNDEDYYILTSSNVCATGRCVLTVVFRDVDEREWAENVWRSLRPPDGQLERTP